jgi:AbrB family looped-hinge helix DNA binding protein
MAEMRVNRDKQNRVYIYLPAFLRDKFDLQNGDKVDVDTDGTSITINPKKK